MGNNHRYTKLKLRKSRTKVSEVKKAVKYSKGERLNWERSTNSDTAFIIFNEEGRMVNNCEFNYHNNTLLVP